jgi:transposase
MTKPISMDLRYRIMNALKEGDSVLQASKRFQVCHQTIYNLLERFEKDNTLEPKPRGGARFPRTIQEEGEAFLREEIKKAPDSTYNELTILYNEKFGKTLTSETVRRTILNMGYVKKSGVSCPQSKD